MKQLKERIENDIHVTSDDLCQAILTDGVDNVRFMVPINTYFFGFFLNNNEFKEVECKIEEQYNREINQNYKLTVVPVVPDKTIASSADYYTSDFISLIKSGIIKILA